MVDDQPLAIGFGDLRGFTSYTAERGDREALRVAEGFASLVRAELDRRGGRLLKTYGDGLMISFDDASAAVESVVDMQRALSVHNEAHADDSLCAGFGLTWGPAIHTGADLFGHSVNLAKRLAEVAKGCQVIVSQEVRDRSATAGYSFRDLGKRKLKGVGSPRVFEVVYRDEAAILSMPDDSLSVVLTNDRRLVLEYAKPVKEMLDAVRAKLDEKSEAAGPAAFLKRKMAERLVRELPKWADAAQKYGGAAFGVEHRLEGIEADFVDGELRIRLPDGRTLAFLRHQIREEDARRFLDRLASLRPAPPQDAPN